MVCWSNAITKDSGFLGITSAFVRNETNSAITISVAVADQQYPYVDMFAFSAVSAVSDVYETHKVDSEINLGSAGDAKGDAAYPGTRLEYGTDDLCVFITRSVYEPGDKEIRSGDCNGHSKSTYPFVLTD